MNDHLQIIERLEIQNMNPDISQGQRDANEHRIQWLKILHKEKPAKTKTVFYDAIRNRLEHGYSITPASLLRE